MDSKYILCEEGKVRFWKQFQNAKEGSLNWRSEGK